MLRMSAALLLLVALCAVVAQGVDWERLDPVVEVRGIWLDAGAIPKTQDGIRQLVRRYHEANLNVLFPEVITRGYTVYPSKLVARAPRFAGAPDPLPAMIKEAHALGMEVHPWVCLFRAGYTKDRGAILTAHPEWAELSKNLDDLSPNGGLWISPVVPEARDFLACLLAELVGNYEVDGLHLDYIRYEVETNVPYGYSEASRALFERQYGIDPFDIDEISIHEYEWQKFRERQINTFVQRIALQTRSIRPAAKISAAVGSEPRSARLELVQNWVNWVDNKWVDFIVPMAYSSDDQHFRGLVNLEKNAIGDRTILVPGIGLFAQKDPQQMVRQIGIARELGAGGQVLFASSYFKEAQSLALGQGPYRCAATLPFREPWTKSRKLCELATQLWNQGNCPEGDSFADRAVDLADYAKYQEAEVRYVPPTAPPLEDP